MDEYDSQEKVTAKDQSSSKEAVSAEGVTPRAVVKKHTARNIVLTIGIIVIGAVSGVGGAAWYTANHGSKDTVAQQHTIITKDDNLVSSIAKRVSPSVVSITTKQLTQQSVFGGVSVAEGAGTGIIINKDGLVLTNRHVVPDGTASVTVVLSDGTSKSAEVLARDTINDVAFIKIKDAKNLQPASLGDSSKMVVGDSVVAIGNALGQFQNTVTTGIISGLGRPITASGEDGSSSENLQNLFQTDAAINPGNSGGPLVNMNGQVIGMNTAVAGDAQNIGFAIPINDVKSSIKSVEEQGKIIRPFLGVRYVMLTPDIAKQLGISSSQGAYIGAGDGQTVVVPGGPADKAGIKSGDIITKVNDQAIDSSHSLVTLIGQHNVGDTVTLTVLRDGKTIELHAKLQATPNNLNN